MKRLTRAGRIGLILSLGASVVACSGWVPLAPSLDGWPLGAAVDCGEIASSGVSTIELAKADLDPDGVSTDVSCYWEGTYLDQGSSLILTRSGAVTIIVFTFRDRTQKAVGVYCGASCWIAGPPQTRAG